jgi:hypothetical protein
MKHVYLPEMLYNGISIFTLFRFVPFRNYPLFLDYGAFNTRYVHTRGRCPGLDYYIPDMDDRQAVPAPDHIHARGVHVYLRVCANTCSPTTLPAQ